MKRLVFIFIIMTFAATASSRDISMPGRFFMDNLSENAARSMNSYEQCTIPDNTGKYAGENAGQEDTTENGNSGSSKILNLIASAIFIAINAYLAISALRQRREMQGRGIQFRFNGNMIIIIGAVIGVFGYIYIMFRGGGVGMLAGFIQIIVSLAAYIIIAHRPLSPEEAEAEQKMREAEGAEINEKKKAKDYIRELLALLVSSAGDFAGKAIIKTGETLTDATRIKETYRNGTLVQRERTFDIPTLIAPLIGVAIVAALILFAVFMAVQLAAILITFLPIYMFISNRRKYNFQQPQQD